MPEKIEDVAERIWKSAPHQHRADLLRQFEKYATEQLQLRARSEPGFPLEQRLNRLKFISVNPPERWQTAPVVGAPDVPTMREPGGALVPMEPPTKESTEPWVSPVPTGEAWLEPAPQTLLKHALTTLPAALAATGVVAGRRLLGRGARISAEETERAIAGEATKVGEAAAKPRYRYVAPAEEGGKPLFRPVEPSTPVGPNVAIEAPLTPRLVDVQPGRKGWQNWYFMNAWRMPEDEVTRAYSLALRAEGVANYGALRGELLRRRFKKSIPSEWQHGASQYLDTGNEQWLLRAPSGVIDAAHEYRATMSAFRQRAELNGRLEEGDVIEHYFTHLIRGPKGLQDEAVNRFRSSLSRSPFYKERRFPHLDELEQWIAAQPELKGVQVVRDPSQVAAAYTQAFYRDEALKTVIDELKTSLTKEGAEVLYGAESRGLRKISPPQGYRVLDVPQLRRALGGHTPMIDARYHKAISNLFNYEMTRSPNAFVQWWDTFNNIHRGIVMALPWKHGLFNVGMDALMMTGLWRGAVQGEWLAARKTGQQLIEAQAQFVEKLMTSGGAKVPTVRNSVMEMYRPLSQIVQDWAGSNLAQHVPGAPTVLGKAGDMWEHMERLNWEKMVGAWMVGVSKLLFDRLEAGEVPKMVYNSGVALEGWRAMSEAQKFQTVGRVVTLLAGQMPRMMFEDPKIIENLRHVLFSPSWNMSNIGIVMAAVNASGGFSMRGLSKDQQRLVSGYMQEYLARSLVSGFVSSQMFNFATSMLFSGGERMWSTFENPQGFRMRIFAGYDRDGRARFAVSPVGYMVKDITNLIGGIQQRVSEGDWTQLQSFARSKLAVLPREAPGVLGYRDPFEPAAERIPGMSEGERLERVWEHVANDIVPYNVFKRGDWKGGIASFMGFPFRRAPQSQMEIGMLKREVAQIRAQMRAAAIKGDDVAGRRWEERLQRRIDLLTQKINDLTRFEQLAPPPAAALPAKPSMLEEMTSAYGRGLTGKYGPGVAE